MSELVTVPFKHKHLPMLRDMLTIRGVPYIKDVSMKTIPKIGYISYKGKIPVAAGFLRKTEGNMVALFDGMVSNPYCGSLLRHEAFNAIFNTLVQDAKDMKLQAIMAFTLDEGMSSRLNTLNFYKMEYPLFALNLREGN